MSKYRAKPIVIDGIRFASQKEGARYQELRLLERAGEIRNLELQPKFSLTVLGCEIGKYVADFLYSERGLLVVEDVKSEPTKTPLWRWKVKHLEAEWGIKVRLV